MPHGRHEYPDNPMLDSTMRFKIATIEAVTRFKESQPWTGSVEERKVKFNALFEALKDIYGLPRLTLRFNVRRPYRFSGDSYFSPMESLIVLQGRFSVITFLHEFAHAMGRDEYGATRWSTNLFAKVFPEKMANLSADRHTLIRNG